MGRQSRNTKQKEHIEKSIEQIDSFFDAEELHRIVGKLDNDIGMATIYRFLKDSEKDKKLYSYMCGRRKIYSKGVKSHCHFVCEKTGKTKHFELDNIDFIKDKIPGTITSFQLEVKGVCEECNINK